MNKQSETYRNRKLLHRLEELQQQEAMMNANWLDSIKNHTGYQELIKDPEWIDLSAAWHEAVEKDKEDRAFVNGRFWEDLSESEKSRIEELNAALYERLFPLKIAIIKLRNDYGIPPIPTDEKQPKVIEKAILPLPPDYPEKMKKWVFSKLWLVIPGIILLVLLPWVFQIVQMLKGLLEWFGIK